MGLDANEKILADYNDVFADIMNVFLFGGKQVINEDQLENSKDRSQYKAGGKLHQQERDVSKFYNDKEIRIAFLGIEHQNKAEEYMPLRVISYDGSSYRSQLLKNEGKKKPYPVITLVLYFGTTHWRYGKSLHEVLDIPANIKEYVSDYKINVIEVAFLNQKQIDMFQSDFKIIADFFVQKRKCEDYVPLDDPIIHEDEFLKMMEIMVGDKRYSQILGELNKERDKLKEGKISMCEVYDKIEGRGIQKGIQMERANTEKERMRADSETKRANAATEREKAARKLANAEKRRADKAEKEIAKLKKLLAEK
ncbi:MAG: Rpn family recombination-promoting nuclease/putative transposase [Lachnospiraceae bacterium]|nr:Rpn family recombination-promoting nuclease/putative transposase [Lachnospiraceae bacterium]